MANTLTTKVTADVSNHNSNIRTAANEVSKYEYKTKQAKKQLNEFQNSISNTVSGLQKLSGSFRDGNITSFATGVTSLGQNLQGLIPTFGSVGSSAASMGAMIKSALGPIGLITTAIGAIGTITVGAVKSVSDFEEHLDGLQSLTGLDDGAMKDISDGAIEISRNFKSSASDIVDSMKLIGSQAPQLLSNKEALMAVTEAANVLAEAAGIEVVDAAKGLTTVMNQMGVDANEAGSIINVLAASSQKGAADVAYLNTAFEKVGTIASTAGMSYQQLAAAVETIAPKFSSADVAGTSLSSTLKALEKQTDDNLKPSIVGINTALENLANKNLSTAESIKLFGDAGYIAAVSLIKQREEFKNFTSEISGTDTAYSQMKTNTDNMAGAINKLKSTWEACMLQFGQSEFIQGIISSFKHLMEVVGHLCKVIFDLIQTTFQMESMKVLLGALYVAWEGLVYIVDAVIEIFEVLIALYNKGVNTMRELWSSLLKKMSDNSVFNWLKKQFENIVKWVMELVTKAKNIWNKFREWLGLEPVKGEIQVTTTTTTNVDPVDENPKTTTSTKTKKKKTPKVKTDTKPKFDTGSIKDYEDRLQKLNDELNNTKVSDERLKEIEFEKVYLEEVIKDLKIRNGLLEQTPKQVKLEPAEGSLQDIQNKLSEANTKINLEVVGSDKYKELAKLISELTGKKNEIELQVKNDTIDEATKKLNELKEAEEHAKEVAAKNREGYAALSSIFGSLGSAIDGTAGKFLELAGQSISAIGQIIPQITTLISAKQAEAMASGSASAAAMPFPANIAAIASIIATITSLFASFAGSFASGGIISGATSLGDFNIARVNSGEMILNNSQQSRLFNLLNGSGGYVNGSSNQQVQFVIKGKELVGVLSNYNKKVNKAL